MTYMPVDVRLDQLGISYRQLDHWIRKGYIVPRRPAPGSGVPRDFTDEEEAVLNRMARLVNRGFTPYAASRVARAARLTGNGARLHVYLGEGVDLYMTEELPPAQPEAYAPGTGQQGGTQ